MSTIALVKLGDVPLGVATTPEAMPSLACFWMIVDAVQLS